MQLLQSTVMISGFKMRSTLQIMLCILVHQSRATYCARYARHQAIHQEEVYVSLMYGHTGITKTKKQVQHLLWWPDLLKNSYGDRVRTALLLLPG